MSGGDDVFGYILVAALLIVPALAISARVALKPIAEAIARLRDAFGSQSASPAELRLASLEVELRAEVRELRAAVERLSAAEAFHAQLRAPTETTHPLESGGASEQRKGA